MNPTKRNILAVMAAGTWINASEFFRNEVLIKDLWAEHYRSLGLAFPSAPVNGMLWMLWGFVFAAMILAVSRRFDLLQTTLICWLMAFVLMWIVIWNLLVMPAGLLTFALPLSLLEVFIAAYLCMKLSPPCAATC
ncbi:MAG: hypothetical protein KKF58_02710 [Gammaproteobacteria bacterium]|nr:hypothetical protein [Gammaproteobacteria bacterium]MBU1447200.1 hypothetical protein [Gammaproteobacteria bacterium]